jgi:hypothetical protein
VPPEFAEAGVLKGFMARGVVRDALVRGQPSRALLDRLAQRSVHVLIRGYLLRLGYDHGDEAAVSLQYADIPDQAVLLIGSLDGLGLHVFATGGHDQGGNPPRHVEVPVIVEIPEVPRSKPSVVEYPVRILGPVAVAGENVRAAREDLAFLVEVAGGVTPLGNG